jgi:hypothetical protein
MFPIRVGQFRHLQPAYRKVLPLDLTSGLPVDSQTASSPNSRLAYVSTGLEGYNGEFGAEQLSHLLKRTRFGCTNKELKEFGNRSLQEVLTRLFVSAAPVPLPLNHYNKPGEMKLDPDVPEGTSFVLAPFNRDFEGDRIVALKCWIIGRILGPEAGIQEKLALFWWNMMPIKLWDIFIAKSGFKYIQMVRQYAMGNFKDLIRALVKDPAMLVFLSGAYNTKDAPDENFARELQELFCIGKGKDAKYTEKDVQEAARVLTGWTVEWTSIHSNGAPESIFDPEKHHIGDKQFSAFYGNRIIKGREGVEGAEELEELLDMLFANQETALHLSRKLYTFFVASEISSQAETNVIKPLAQLIRSSNYDLLPALKALLGSAHFFDAEIMGSLIKSPMDYTLGLWRSFGLPVAENPAQETKLYSSILWQMSGMGMEIGDPPNVAGWPPYYQTPQYDKIWINTDSIGKRAIASDSILYWGFWISEALQLPANLLAFTKSMPNPEDPGALIEDFCLLHMGIRLVPEQLAQAKRILLSGQEYDYYWTSAWQAHNDSPNQEEKANVVLNRLKPTFQILLQMAEAQLM